MSAIFSSNAGERPENMTVLRRSSVSSLRGRASATGLTTGFIALALPGVRRPASVLAPGRRQRDLAARVLGRILRLDLGERHLEVALLQDLVGPGAVDQVLGQLGH